MTENPKKSAGDKKCPMHLLTPAMLEGVSWAMQDGANKYGPFNWRETRVDHMTYIGATRRHLNAIMRGEDIDPDCPYGTTHWAKIGANVNLVLDSIENGVLDDNRPSIPAAVDMPVNSPTKYNWVVIPIKKDELPDFPQNEDWGDVDPQYRAQVDEQADREARLDAYYQGK